MVQCYVHFNVSISHLFTSFHIYTMDVTGTYYFYLLCQHTDSVADSKKMVIFLQVSCTYFQVSNNCSWNFQQFIVYVQNESSLQWQNIN